MSFSRARLHRFNEISTDNPSPTRYDPKLGEKAKGGVIGAKERERTSSLSEALPTGGTPFRTPQPPSIVKKHSCVASAEKLLSVPARNCLFQDATATFTKPSSDIEDGELRSEFTKREETINELERLVSQLTAQIHENEELNEELKQKVATLEVEKSHLECAIANNDNFETQISELIQQKEALEAQIRELQSEKEDLLAYKCEAEARITKLEEASLEYERRILSFEGILEQVAIEYKAKAQEQQEKFKSSIDRLQGNVATLEMDVAKLEESKSQNEQTIFGLETQISSLNLALESSRGEAAKITKDLQEMIDEKEKTCAMQDGIISALDLQLETKTKESEKKMQGLLVQIKSLETEKSDVISQMVALKEEQEKRNVEITLHLKAKEEEIERYHDEKRQLIQNHKEELFRLQNELETKVLSQMQESEQALLEKEAVLKLADLKYTKMMNDIRIECDRKVSELEREASHRQSELVEVADRQKEKYQSRIKDMESNISQVLESKEREAAVQNQRYDEVVSELKTLTSIVQSQKQEIEKLSDENGRITLCQEIEKNRLMALCADNEAKLLDVNKIFQEERKKNEKLSEHLGELDTRIAEVDGELKVKMADVLRLSEELKKAKDENNLLKVKNLDLQLTASTNEDKAKTLKMKLDTSRAEFDAQLVALKEELTEVRRQCRKFEIAITDTRKSLEALGKRLMESESEVERLNADNEILKMELALSGQEKTKAEQSVHQLLEMKIDLEQRLATSETVEDNLKHTIKELELKNCELELNRNEILIWKETLEQNRAAEEQSLHELKELVNDQNIKMVQLERSSLEQIESVSLALLGKFDEFQKFSTEKIQELNAEIRRLKKEKKDTEEAYALKCEQFENLNTDNDILKTTFDITNKESESLKKQYEEQKIELDKAMMKLTDLEEQKSLLANTLDVSEASREMSEKKLIENNNVIEELSTKVDDLKDNLQDLEIQMVAKQDEVNGLSNDLTALRQEADKMKSDIADKEKIISDLLITKKEFHQNLANTTDKVVSLLLDLETERKTIKELESRNHELASELEKEREAKQKADTKTDELTQELCQLKLSSETQHDEEQKKWKSLWERVMDEKEAMSKEMLAITERKDEYKGHCRRLEKENAKAIADMNSAINDFNEIHKILKEKDDELAKSHKRIQDMEKLIGPFREQLEQYETERMFLESDREQLRRQHLEQAAKLGHQNHKQKIQHVVKLKADMFELKKENDKLRADVKHKSKTIEKLREELGEHPKRLFIGGKRPTSTPFKGKENDDRVSPIPYLKQEVMSPSALRQRNQ